MLETNGTVCTDLNSTITNDVTAEPIRRETPLPKIMQVRIGYNLCFTDEVEIHDLLRTESRRPFVWFRVKLRFVEHGNFMIAVESGDESVS